MTRALIFTVELLVGVVVLLGLIWLANTVPVLLALTAAAVVFVLYARRRT